MSVWRVFALTTCLLSCWVFSLNHVFVTAMRVWCCCLILQTAVTFKRSALSWIYFWSSCTYLPTLQYFQFRKVQFLCCFFVLRIYVYEILWWHLLNAVTLLHPQKKWLRGQKSDHISAEKCVIVQHAGKKEFVTLLCRCDIDHCHQSAESWKWILVWDAYTCMCCCCVCKPTRQAYLEDNNVL